MYIPKTLHKAPNITIETLAAKTHALARLYRRDDVLDCMSPPASWFVNVCATHDLVDEREQMLATSGPQHQNIHARSGDENSLVTNSRGIPASISASRDGGNPLADGGNLLADGGNLLAANVEEGLLRGSVSLRIEKCYTYMYVCMHVRMCVCAYI